MMNNNAAPVSEENDPSPTPVAMSPSLSDSEETSQFILESRNEEKIKMNYSFHQDEKMNENQTRDINSKNTNGILKHDEPSSTNDVGISKERQQQHQQQQQQDVEESLIEEHETKSIEDISGTLQREKSQVSISKQHESPALPPPDRQQDNLTNFVPGGTVSLPPTYSTDDDVKPPMSDHEPLTKSSSQNNILGVSQKKTPDENISKPAVCHPSKIQRENSSATEQPAPISRSTSLIESIIEENNNSSSSSIKSQTEDTMAPNLVRHEELNFVEKQDESDGKQNTAAAGRHYHQPPATDDMDASLSTHQSMAGQNNNNNNTGFEEEDKTNSASEEPPIQHISASFVPNRPTSLTNDDVFDATSMMVGPSPGTVIFQQPHGSYMQTLTAQHSFGYPYQMLQHAPVPIPPQLPPHMMAAPPQNGAISGGRRKITLRLQEDAPIEEQRRGFFFRRSRRSLNNGDTLSTIQENNIDRGSVTVSWFEGTTSVELQEHVRKSVIRKMSLTDDATLDDMRIIDQSMDPPEEIVLSPYIPDGSKFLLRFSSKKSKRHNEISAPHTPSQAPSPDPSQEVTSLNAQLLARKLNVLHPPKVPSIKSESRDKRVRELIKGGFEKGINGTSDSGNGDADVNNNNNNNKDNDDDSASRKTSDYHHEDDIMSYHPEDNIEARLKQLADLMIADRRSRMKSPLQTKEKRQVIFVLANYFILFLSLIAISAEIQSRAPKWLNWVETQLKNVQKCSNDQEALYECVSKGDFSGLIASFILWISRSAATKRIFLFGFESPKKLWNVVYESLVTAVCWGTSYMFIRRGLNPDTRTNFLRKYWKDAVYGSLAGFNASFMKQVMKNLIPQEALEDALQERQLKILSWLPSFN